MPAKVPKMGSVYFVFRLLLLETATLINKTLFHFSGLLISGRLWPTVMSVMIYLFISANLSFFILFFMNVFLATPLLRRLYILRFFLLFYLLFHDFMRRQYVWVNCIIYLICFLFATIATANKIGSNRTSSTYVYPNRSVLLPCVT